MLIEMQFHPSWNSNAKNRLQHAIDAHGGWSSWESCDSFEFRLKKFYGGLVFVKGLGRSFYKPQRLIVFPKKRRVEFFYDQHVDVFEDGKITLSKTGRIIGDGRSLFRKTTFEQWKPEHVAYFFGYAWSNYMSYPFILPQFELLNYESENGISKFEINFPDHFHTHSRIQKFYFDSQNQMFRHDYRAEFAGPLVYGAHYTTDYVTKNGLKVGFIRRVYPRFGNLVVPVYGIYGEIEF